MDIYDTLFVFFSIFILIAIPLLLAKFLGNSGMAIALTLLCMLGSPFVYHDPLQGHDHFQGYIAPLDWATIAVDGFKGLVWGLIAWGVIALLRAVADLAR